MHRPSSIAIAAALTVGGLCCWPAISQTSSVTQSTSSGQGDVAAPPAEAQASGSAAASGSTRTGGDSAALAGGSTVNSVLTTPVDSRKSKPGDAVSARTVQPTRTEAGAPIPKGSTLSGHVTEVRMRGAGETRSAIGILFDRAITPDGREIPLRSVGIQAVAASERMATASAMDSGAMTTGGGGAGGAYARNGGVLGNATGVAGATAGRGLGGVGGTGTVVGNASAASRGGSGAMGGLNGAGLLSSNSSGVFGLDALSLAPAAPGAAGGSLISSSEGSVRLERGTRMLLGSQSTSQAGAKTQSTDAGADRKGSKAPDRPNDADRH